MAKIAMEVKELMCKLNGLSMVGTVDSGGMPNVAPRFILETPDDEFLVFGDIPKHHTYQNLRRNPKCTVCIVDPATYASFQLKGEATFESTGPIQSKVKEKLTAMGLGNEPWEAVKIRVTEVFSHRPEEAWKVQLNKAGTKM